MRTQIDKYTVVYKKNKDKRDLVLQFKMGDNLNLEVPEGYVKKVMELDLYQLPYKQIYEQLGVEYFDETQLVKEDFLE